MTLLRSWFGGKRGVKVSKPSMARTRLIVENLENRCLMSNSTLPIVPEPSPFVGGVSVAAGDINGDGFDGVVTGPAQHFEIKDFSFGVENPTTIGSSTGGAGAGKIKFNEFTIKKTTDAASPAFFKNCCAGAHYPEVVIDMRKAGGDPMSDKPFMQFKFETVFTTKIDWSGPGDEGPEESITFVYGKLGVQYRAQEPTGPIQYNPAR